MNPRTARWIAWSIVILYVGLATIGLSLQVITNRSYSNISFPVLISMVVAATSWPVTGAIIVTRHPRHLVGWLMCVGMLGGALDMFSAGYVFYDTFVYKGSLPGLSAPLVWLHWSGFPFATVSVTLIALYFPTGKLPTPRWRWVVTATITAFLGYLAILALEPAPVHIYSGIFLANPIGIQESVWALLEPTLWVSEIVLALSNILALFSLFLRFRRAKGHERQQIKWLFFPASLYGIFLPVMLVALETQKIVLFWAGIVIGLPAIASLVIAVAFAIFRYRLYDVDLFINRSLLYGGLTLAIIAIYILVVSVLGMFFQAQGNLIIALFATGVVAIIFQPLRERLQRLVNRVIYGERDDPIEVFFQLGRQMEVALPPDQVLDRLVATISQTLKLPFVGIALEGNRMDQLAAQSGSPSDLSLEYPIIFQGIKAGTLLVSPRHQDETFAPVELRLLRNLARQAGAAVRNAQLASDLQRSRQNLVTTREEERQRLRRDLHDGIGPAMAGLTLKLDAVKDILTAGQQKGEWSNLEKAVDLLTELKTQAQGTVSDIRHIVYALRPPSLDVLGLASSLQAHFDQVAAPARIQIRLDTKPPEFPRFSAAVEVAAYRIVLEAVTNVIHHANARNCFVFLEVLNNHLHLEVADDGIGLSEKGDFHAANLGVGMNSMRERAEEIGGRFSLSSSSHGTIIRADIPLIVDMRRAT